MFEGDGSKLEDYPFYGAPVFAVADAVVVSTYDGLDPQVPFKRDLNIKPVDITGNSIVLDLGGGTFAAYAHLLKGSIEVKPGDKVISGQQLAKLGKLCNCAAPSFPAHGQSVATRCESTTLCDRRSRARSSPEAPTPPSTRQRRASLRRSTRDFPGSTRLRCRSTIRSSVSSSG